MKKVLSGIMVCVLATGIFIIPNTVVRGASDLLLWEDFSCDGVGINDATTSINGISTGGPQTSGWLSGGWQAAGNVEIANTKTNSEVRPLVYGDLKHSGVLLSTANVIGGGDSVYPAAHPFKSIAVSGSAASLALGEYISSEKIGKVDKALWFSALMRKETDDYNQESVSVALLSEAKVSSEKRLEIGYFKNDTSSPPMWGVRLVTQMYTAYSGAEPTITEQARADSELPVSAGEVVLAVAKIEFKPTMGGEKVTVWFNPDKKSLGEPEPIGEMMAELAIPPDQELTIKALGFYNNIKPVEKRSDFRFGDVRFGRSYKGVTPLGYVGAENGNIADFTNSEAAPLSLEISNSTLDSASTVTENNQNALSDKNLDTKWSSSSSDGSLTFELSQQFIIKRVSFETANSFNGEIEVSTDKSDWAIIAPLNITTPEGRVDFGENMNTLAKYVRITGVGEIGDMRIHGVRAPMIEAIEVAEELSRGNDAYISYSGVLFDENDVDVYICYAVEKAEAKGEFSITNIVPIGTVRGTANINEAINSPISGMHTIQGSNVIGDIKYHFELRRDDFGTISSEEFTKDVKVPVDTIGFLGNGSPLGGEIDLEKRYGEEGESKTIDLDWVPKNADVDYTSIQWQNTNPDVAEIDVHEDTTSASVTAVAKTATAGDGSPQVSTITVSMRAGGDTSSGDLTVEADAVLGDVSLIDSISLASGIEDEFKSALIWGEFVPSNAKERKIRWSATGDVVVTPLPGDETFATVSIQGNNDEGTGEVKAEFMVNDAVVYTKTCHVTITAGGVAVTAANMSQGKFLLNVGETLDLKQRVVFTPSNATNKNINWSIKSGGGAVSISEGGVLTAKSKGTAVLEGKSEAKPNVVFTSEIEVILAPSIDIGKPAVTFTSEFWDKFKDYDTNTTNTAYPKRITKGREYIVNLDSDIHIYSKTLGKYVPFSEASVAELSIETTDPEVIQIEPFGNTFKIRVLADETRPTFTSIRAVITGESVKLLADGDTTHSHPYEKLTRQYQSDESEISINVPLEAVTLSADAAPGIFSTLMAVSKGSVDTGDPNGIKNRINQLVIRPKGTMSYKIPNDYFCIGDLPEVETRYKIEEEGERYVFAVYLYFKDFEEINNRINLLPLEDIIQGFGQLALHNSTDSKETLFNFTYLDETTVELTPVSYSPLNTNQIEIIDGVPNLNQLHLSTTPLITVPSIPPTGDPALKTMTIGNDQPVTLYAYVQSSSVGLKKVWEKSMNISPVLSRSGSFKMSTQTIPRSSDSVSITLNRNSTTNDNSISEKLMFSPSFKARELREGVDFSVDNLPRGLKISGFASSDTELRFTLSGDALQNVSETKTFNLQLKKGAFRNAIITSTNPFAVDTTIRYISPAPIAINIEPQDKSTGTFQPSYSGGGGGGGSGGSSGFDHFQDFEQVAQEPMPTQESPNTTANKNSGPTIFSDVDDTLSWAKEAIAVLYEKDIIKGTSNTTFSPNDMITRAEFSALIVRAFNLEKSGEIHAFPDLSEDAWYKEAIESAVENGILRGYEDKTVKPEAFVTREEMVTMIIRLLNRFGDSSNDEDHTGFTAELDVFQDKELISEWAKAGTGFAVSKKIITGIEVDTFAPKENATRAQAAVILYRTLLFRKDGEQGGAE